MAIKTIKKSKIETEADLIRIRREIQIMSSVQHPNIIHIYEGRSNQILQILNIHYRKAHFIVIILHFMKFSPHRV